MLKALRLVLLQIFVWRHFLGCVIPAVRGFSSQGVELFGCGEALLALVFQLPFAPHMVLYL